jgi:hypothetical protein
MAKPLTPEQLETLRTAPMGDMPSKVDLALALTQAKQADIIAAYPSQLSTTIVSRAINGRSAEPGARALIAAFFRCHVEDLWPPVREEAHAE